MSIHLGIYFTLAISSFTTVVAETTVNHETEKYFNVGVMFPKVKNNLPMKSILNFAAM
jgi:hypothetical protein